MLRSFIIFGVFGVLLAPVQSDPISVCHENDSVLRVDCLIEPQPNKIASYEFSWSSGTKEIIINTNVSGSSADRKFLRKNYVTELEPHGYRLILKDIIDTLPHNTTYMCKMSGVVARVNVEKSQLVPCSAVSVLLRSSWSWTACVLLFVCYIRS